MSLRDFIKRRRPSSKDLAFPSTKVQQESSENFNTNSPFNASLDFPRFLLKEMLHSYPNELISVFEQVFTNEELERVVASLLAVYGSDRKMLENLFRRIFEAEISATVDENTLFRGSSTSIKLFSLYTSEAGKEYLARTVLPFVTKYAAMPTALEVDPSRPGFSQNNVRPLVDSVFQLVDRIEASLAESALGRLCLPYPVLAALVGARFPERRLQIVGGFFFLRFLCPYLVNPPLSQVSPAGRRNLILISKIVQNISNGSLFGEKEQFLQCANAMIEETRPRVQFFLQYISDASNAAIPKSVAAGLQSDSPRHQNDSPRSQQHDSPRQRPKIFVSTAERIALDELQAMCGPREYILNQTLSEIGSDPEALSQQFDFIMQKYRSPFGDSDASNEPSEDAAPTSPAAKMAANSSRQRAGSPLPSAQRLTPIKKREVKSAHARLEGSAAASSSSSNGPSSPRTSMLLPGSPRAFAAAAKVKFATALSPFSGSFVSSSFADSENSRGNSTGSARKRASPESDIRKGGLSLKRRDLGNKKRDPDVITTEQLDAFQNLLECDTWEF
ncbi:MAG: hypothetical protein Q8P67_14620 [archaeon]|nr:hypothetical protein [archaeon]